IRVARESATCSAGGLAAPRVESTDAALPASERRASALDRAAGLCRIRLKARRRCGRFALRRRARLAALVRSRQSVRRAQLRCTESAALTPAEGLKGRRKMRDGVIGGATTEVRAFAAATLCGLACACGGGGGGSSSPPPPPPPPPPTTATLLFVT